MNWLSVMVAIGVSLANFGGFYNFDVPQELSEQLMVKYQVNQMQLNLTYTLYYLPNIIFMLVVPYYASNIQTSYVVAIATGVQAIGAAISAAGVPYNSWNLILLGRLVYGIGGEICLTTIDELTEEWFKSGGLSVVLSTTLFLNQLGMASSNYSSVPLMEWSRDLFTPFFVSTILCFFSFLGAYGVYLIDSYVKFDKKRIMGEGVDRGNLNVVEFARMIELSENRTIEYREGGNKSESNREDFLTNKNNSEEGEGLEMIEIGQIPQNRDEEQNQGLLWDKDIQQSSRVSSKSTEINFRLTLFDLLTFRAISLLICYALIASIYYQFNAISTELLIRRYSFSLNEAKNLMAEFSLEAAISMPFFGLFFNYYPGRVIWGAISGVLTVLEFLIFLVLGSKPGVWIHLPLLLVSQFTSIAFIVCFSMLSLSVPSRSVGVLFGFASVLESVICTVQPVVLGEVLEHQNFREFQIVLKVFLGLSLVYLAVNVALMVFDLRNGSLLYMLEWDERVQQLRDNFARESEFRAKK